MNEMTLRDYTRVLFRHMGVIFICCVVVTSIVVAGQMLKTKEYEAQVKMLVSSKKSIEAPYYKELYENETTLTQIEIVTSNPVLERAVRVLHLEDKPHDYELRYASSFKRKWLEFKSKLRKTREERLSPEQQQAINFRRAVDELRGSIRVEPVKDTSVFIIKVRDYNRIGAAVMANVVSRSYVIFDLEQQLAELKLKYGPRHPLAQQLQDNIEDMTRNLNGGPLPNTDSIGPASVKIIQQASVPLAPVTQKKSVIGLLAFVMSLFLGVILAFIFEYMDQTVKSTSGLENNLQVSLLGSIPRIRRRRHMIINTERQRLPRKYTASLTNLADQVRLLMNNKGFKSLLVAGCNLKDGTTVTAANLAVCLAEQSGKRVALIDANFRYPALHKLFNIKPEATLTDVLSGNRNYTDALYTARQNLLLLPVSTTKLNPATLLDSNRMRKLMDDLKGQFDVIIIDCAQLNTHREGYILSTVVDKTLLVVAENRTRLQVLQRSLQSLRELKADALGAVLNFRTYPIPKFVYERI